MSKLAQLRADLAADLATTNATVHTHLPAQLHPPAVIIEPGDPYLEDSERGFGCFQVTYDLHVITPLGTEETKTAGLDDLIQQTISSIDTKWAIRSIRRPFHYDISGRAYYATVITITHTIRLEGS